MKWIMKRNNQKGMSLVELLVALAIFGLVILIINSFLIMGLSIFKRVAFENQLRNQGDMMYSQLVSELKNAVYVRPVGTGNSSFVYVVPSSDSNEYVREFRMSFVEDPHQDHYIEVAALNKDGSQGAVHQYRLVNHTFTFQAEFTVERSNVVNLNLTFQRKNNNELAASEHYDGKEKTVININSSIQLFRND